MTRETGKKILQLQEQVWQDVDFQALSQEHNSNNARFLETVNRLPPDQQEPIWDYIGLLVEIHHKMLEYAVNQK